MLNNSDEVKVKDNGKCQNNTENLDVVNVSNKSNFDVCTCINYHLILIHNDAEFLRCTLNAHHKVNMAKSVNSNRENLLHLACKLNKPQFIKPLMALKCEVFKQDLDGRTPLHMAMMLGHYECIEQFVTVLELFSNLNNDDETKATNELKDNLIKMFKMYSHHGYTIVHMAVLKNLPHVLEAMLKFCRKYHIDVLAYEVLGTGNSLLHLAVENQLHDMARVIVTNVPESLQFCNYGGSVAYATDERFIKRFQQVLVFK